jgi:hypothetical protein
MTPPGSTVSLKREGLIMLVVDGSELTRSAEVCRNLAARAERLDPATPVKAVADAMPGSSAAAVLPGVGSVLGKSLSGIVTELEAFGQALLDSAADFDRVEAALADGLGRVDTSPLQEAGPK